MITRPKGITVLSVLNIIAGLVVLVFTIATTIIVNPFDGIIDYTIIYSIALKTILYGIVPLALAIGMMRGSRWSWWVAGFFYLYYIARNVFGILEVVQNHDLYMNIDGGFGRYISREVLRVAFGAIVYMYLISDDVINFFKVKISSRWRATGVILGSVLIMSGVYYFIDKLL